jgi:uncharacterized repeat protein (TIGR01451 family)
MSTSPLFRTLSMAALSAAVALGAISGCASQQKSPEPAPAPKPAAAKPAAPAKSGPNCATAYYPTGDKATSVLMLEKCAPAQVAAGQAFDYTITVMNISNASAEDVVVTDTIPAGFSVASTDPAGANMGAGKSSWNIGNLGPGQSKTIKVKGSATAKGSITNCATASYTLAACITVDIVQPALSITKTAPAEVVLCDNIPVKLVVTNSGTGSASNVKVTDTFPAGLTTTDGKTSVTLDGGTLASGQSKEFNLSLKASKTGSYQNGASAAADGNLKAESNKTTTVVKQPKLAVDIECPGDVLLGRDVTFKVNVKNTGDTACDTTLTANIPAGSTFVKADNGGTMAAGNVTWKVGSLKPGESKGGTYTVKSAGAGTLSVTAKATCECADAASDTCSTGVKGTPDMGTLLDDHDGVVDVGANHTYHYQVTNQGQVDLTNVKVIVTLPEGMDFVSTNAPGAPKVEGRKLTWTAATALKPGEKRDYNLVVKVTKAGEYLVLSDTSCSELKSSVRDDEVTVFIAPN